MLSRLAMRGYVGFMRLHAADCSQPSVTALEYRAMGLQWQKLRRCIGYVLLATSANFSLLGEGLHLVVPGCEHHHGQFACSHKHESHGECQTTDSTGVRSHDACDAHDCQICAFLSQLHSPPASAHAAIAWRPLCVAIA